MPLVASVSAGRSHGPVKPVRMFIELVEGLGVEGDAHAGRTVQHRYSARKSPDAPNLRQVHLLGRELHEALAAEEGMAVGPGEMGENILTGGIDLPGLPAGTTLRLGADAAVELTGVRTPCTLLNRVRKGLMKAVVARGDDGAVVHRCGVMAVVRAGGVVAPGDQIVVELPPRPHRPLEPV